MLYILNGRQVIAEIKGTYKCPVVDMAYWADNDQDLSLEEVEAFLIECSDEISAAAYTHNNLRIAAGDRRDC